MKKITFLLILLCYLLTMGIIYKSSPYIKLLTNPQNIIAQLPELGIKLNYVDEEDGLYKGFILEIKDKKRLFNWENVTDPSWKPELLLTDLNYDGKKEVVVIFTVRYETGALKQDVHVVDTYYFKEIKVDRPLDIIQQHVSTNISNIGEAKLINIKIDGQTYSLKLNKTYTDSWFHNVEFGSIINFEVVNNELKAYVPEQVSSSRFAGIIAIEYGLKEDELKMKEIGFNKDLL